MRICRCPAAVKEVFHLSVRMPTDGTTHVPQHLRGDKATTHWIALDLLKTIDAEPVANRVIEDRNRFTGGGVTAGIDFGLTLAAKLTDERYAKWVQMVMEYSPQTPFQSGSPDQASSELTTLSQTMFEPFLPAAKAAAVNASSVW